MVEKINVKSIQMENKVFICIGFIDSCNVMMKIVNIIEVIQITFQLWLITLMVISK